MIIVSASPTSWNGNVFSSFLKQKNDCLSVICDGEEFQVAGQAYIVETTLADRNSVSSR